MRSCWRTTCASVLLTLAVAPVFAQQTTGNMGGRVVDQQNGAVSGVTVTARNVATGFTRSDVTDGVGIYRLAALPAGVYDLTAELKGFVTRESKGIELNVATTLTIDIELRVAQVAETVTVTGATPSIETSSSSVGGIVDIERVDSLPLNGRQFANLAATIPGVGLGFHSDTTKSTQYSPQINGGNGRNINYQVDGGDNNDDTVGGLLQLFPLEAIQEFNFITTRYKAEYGRSNGGVMNIVTKSGTNLWSGSAVEFFRDREMNARTTSEKIAGVPRQPYRRNQYGGSFGGPVARDKAHFFAAFERVQQDTKQAVDTKGLFPDLNGVYDTPYTENLFTGKVTASVSSNRYVSVRYGFNNNAQPYGAALNATPDNWGDSKNKFNSINLNCNWVLGGTKLNEFVFQYAGFLNNVDGRSNLTFQRFPNGVFTGQNVNTPQTTEQQKWQFHDDFSWHVAGMGGLGHDFKTGVNFVNEPRLFLTFDSAKGVVQTRHLDNNVNGPVSEVLLADGDSSSNIPTKQYGVYLQDDWRLTDRITLNLGVRYDYVAGIVFDQSANPNFVTLQSAGAAGRFAGVIGMEDFGKTPRDDRNNIQPRMGFAYDVRGNGRDVVRAGWGTYTDFGYTNSNGLFAAADAFAKGFGAVFQASNPSGLRNQDGSFYQVGQPLTNLTNEITSTGKPLFGYVVSPRLEQPESWQTAVGWSHEFGASTVVSGDYVHIDGKKLNLRAQLNVRPNGGPRRFADLSLSPNTANLRPAVSRGKSRYDALIVALRRRMTRGIDFTVSYTLAKSTSNIGNAVDELNTANIQDVSDPFDAPVQMGPTVRTDARHRISASAVIQVAGGVQVSPVWFFRTALPVGTILGVDLNNDFANNDIPQRAYAYNPDDPTRPLDLGPCKTVNCGRGYRLSHLNLRVSRKFRLAGRAGLEAIGELFNVFNTPNPSEFVTTQYLGLLSRPNTAFMTPTAYSGDFRQLEQRVGQVGFRFTF